MRPSPPSEGLLIRYRHLRDSRASAMVRSQAYNDWFRQSCAEGRRPSALRIDSPDETERFWAWTIPGPDGHVYWTGPKRFRQNNTTCRRPQRWTWAKSGRRLTAYTEIENTCGEENCVNVEHMRERHRSERRIQFSDDRAFGALHVLTMRLGHTPGTLEWDAAKLPVTAWAMKARFGSWGKFCRKAGLQPKRHASIDAVDCRDAIRALAAKVGRTPTRADWHANHDWLRERGYPSSETTLRTKLNGSFASVVREVLS